MAMPEPLAVWSTASADLTSQVDALLSARFGRARCTWVGDCVPELCAPQAPGPAYARHASRHPFTALGPHRAQCARSCSLADNSSVVFFFAGEIPHDPRGEQHWLRDFTLVFGSDGERVHNAIAVGGPACLYCEFHSSAGEQEMSAHVGVLNVLQCEIERLLGQRGGVGDVEAHVRALSLHEGT